MRRAEAHRAGEEFEYRFVVPDAGTFWYHSHANETVQMEHGLYGSLIVEDDTDPVFDGERVLMFDDMMMTNFEVVDPSRPAGQHDHKDHH